MKVLATLDWAAVAGQPGWMRLALVTSLMLVIVLGGYVYRLHELRLSLAQGQVVARDLQQRHSQAHARLQHLAAEQQALQAAQLQWQEARWRLAGGEDISELVDQLTLAGHEHGLTFEQIGVTPQPPQQDFRGASLELRVRGAYPGLRVWLDDWLAQVRVLRIREAVLAQSTTHPGRVEARLLVQTYHPGEDLDTPPSLAHEPARNRAAVAHNLFQPWASQRTHADLSRVPLEQMDMVGSLFQGGQRQAVIASAGRLYRVSLGDRLGPHQGRVVTLHERQLVVRKRVYIGDTWQERSRTLSLRHGADQKGKDDAENKDVVGTGNPVGDWQLAGGAG
ncbi:pilus assembly protein PilP [Pseudomonas sp. RP23018S]|uniref:pilus assembly protein PilP n=1 Tax=Pseudomonas sp. RP23018S TaxID=3096037 RepID=UPI002ACA3E4D|nr:pilus assembly protein PilP [Pseudomonas sp. RP23018S]MDZ5603972.1 pilus assembly protein PilP [Pseudomonas sp. RP23018S]